MENQSLSFPDLFQSTFNNERPVDPEAAETRSPLVQQEP